MTTAPTFATIADVMTYVAETLRDDVHRGDVETIAYHVTTYDVPAGVFRLRPEYVDAAREVWAALAEIVADEASADVPDGHVEAVVARPTVIRVALPEGTRVTVKRKSWPPRGNARVYLTAPFAGLSGYARRDAVRLVDPTTAEENTP